MNRLVEKGRGCEKAIITIGSLQKNTRWDRIKKSSVFVLSSCTELKPLEFLDRNVFHYPFFRILSGFIRKIFDTSGISFKISEKKIYKTSGANVNC